MGIGTVFGHLAAGIGGIFTDPQLLLLLIAGMLTGLLFAAIPGLSVVMAVILLLPFTYGMSAKHGLVMLAAAYMGGVFGGAIPAILLHIPGDSIHIPLLWESRGLVGRNLASKAVGTAMFAATLGGLVGVVFLTLLGPQIARVALSFGAPEYFAIIFFGLCTVTAVGNVGGGKERPLRHALLALFLGMLIGCIGVDDTFATPRFTFGAQFLQSGVNFVIVMIGIYAIAEVLERFEWRFRDVAGGEGSGQRFRPPTAGEFLRLWPSWTRGTGVGVIMGLIPAAGATPAAFISYGVERQLGRARRLLGTGRMEGVAAPQSAASATVGGALTPLLTLGIPGSAADAVILGAFLLKGIEPGPSIYSKQTALVYSIIGSLYVTLVLMVIATIVLTGLFVRVLSAPPSIVAGLVVVFSFIGAYALRNNIADVIIMLIFGIVGYFMRRYDYPVAPLILGVILGPLDEKAFVTSLYISHDPFVFFQHTISLAFMLLAFAVLCVPVAGMARKHLRRHRSPVPAMKEPTVPEG